MPEEPCTICSDIEPFHVHNDGQRIEEYFTVGRGLSDFESALQWQRKAKQRAAQLVEARALAVRLPITGLIAALGAYDAQPGCVECVEALVREARAVVEATTG